MKLLLLLMLTTIYVPTMAQRENYRLSTHMLDATSGRHIQNVDMEIFHQNDNGDWISIETGNTGETGRVNWLNRNQNHRGLFKIKYYTAPYFERMNQDTKFPYIEVIFSIQDDEHYHIPLVLTGHRFTTYRGS